MNLLIFIFFGFLSTSQGRYRIPEHDTCVLRVLLCDDFIKPLTPIDNSTLEMFQTIGEVNDICDELSKFRACLKSAENFCKETSQLDIGFQLLNNRHLAFDLCVRNSSLQDEYMMIEGCVNKYSHSVIKFCTDRTIEIVGLQFFLGDYDAECRYLGELHHCHIAIVRDLCGSIAGNLLEKLVVFRGERDFLCVDYEKRRMSELETFYASMDSYIKQYKNIASHLKTEGKSETTDKSKDHFETKKDFIQDEASSVFRSRISGTTDEDDGFGNIYITDSEHPFDSEMFHSTKQHGKDSTIIPSNIKSRFSDHKYNFYASENSKYPIDTEIRSTSYEEKPESKPAIEDKEKDLEESFIQTAYQPSKYSQHLYRPNELYRPRLGEAFEVEDEPIWDEDMIKDTEKDTELPSTKLSLEDTLKDYCSAQINAKQICSVLQENNSLQVDKLAAASKENCVKIADSLDLNTLENYEQFPAYEKEDILSSYDFWKFEDPENIIDHQTNHYEEIYTVTPSTKIANHKRNSHTTYDGSKETNFNRDSEALEAVEDSEALEAVEDSEALEADEDSEALEADEDSEALEAVEDSEALEAVKASNEEISAKSEIKFDRRLNNPSDLEEMFFNVFELLARLKVNVMRMHKKLRKTRMKKK